MLDNNVVNNNEKNDAGKLAELKDFIKIQNDLRKEIQMKADSSIRMLKERTEEELRTIDHERAHNMTRLQELTNDFNQEYSKANSEEAYDLISKLLNASPSARTIDLCNEREEVDADFTQEEVTNK